MRRSLHVDSSEKSPPAPMPHFFSLSLDAVGDLNLKVRTGTAIRNVLYIDANTGVIELCEFTPESAGLHEIEITSDGFPQVKQ